jgi:hypothetical protein
MTKMFTAKAQRTQREFFILLSVERGLARRDDHSILKISRLASGKQKQSAFGKLCAD